LQTMANGSPRAGLGVAQVIAIAVITYVVLDWLKTKPFGDPGGYGGLIVVAALLLGLIAYAVFSGWLAAREVEREELHEARRHGYESWAEYMAAEGDEFVRDSWQRPAQRERNRLSRRLKRLFGGGA